MFGQYGSELLIETPIRERQHQRLQFHSRLSRRETDRDRIKQTLPQRLVTLFVAIVFLLLLLRERTEGHRTPEETQVLDELIYDLQLRYVEVMKRFG